MAVTGDKSSAIRPPSWLGRAEKLQFRRIVSQLNAGESGVSEAQADLIADLISARSRLRALGLMQRRLLASDPVFYAQQILQLNTALNSTTALARRLAEKLGLQ